jgi:hypothetical protein
VAALLVSDSEREYTVGLLRKHLLTGRLTTEEFEQRVDEAWRARFASDLWQALRWLPAEAPARARTAGRSGAGSAAASVVLSLLGLALLCFTLGLASPVALPLSVTGWSLGREARRKGAESVRAAAITGEVIGVIGTVMAAVLMAGCAALVAGSV